MRLKRLRLTWKFSINETLGLKANCALRCIEFDAKRNVQLKPITPMFYSAMSAVL